LNTRRGATHVNTRRGATHVNTWHIITGEYPPSPGGVSDYCHAVASGLAGAGDEVHVWCPKATAQSGVKDQNSDVRGVHVHAIAGSWGAADRHRVDRAMDEIAGDKHLLVQWVPHAFGARSLNVGVCRWLRNRAGRGDVLDVMVHEPGLGFGEGALAHHAAAAVHRLMLVLLLNRARKVWMSIPAWESVLRPWAFGRRDLTFSWLPVPSNVPVRALNGQVASRRAELLRGSEGVILGHFSTYPPSTRDALRELLPTLLADAPDLQVQLLGRNADEAAAELRGALGVHHSRVHAAADTSPERLSRDLQSCDLLVQPYTDGVSTRRGTLMAALAHGLPVVTTTGRLSESFWKDSDSIVAMPSTDASRISRTIIELAGQPERRIRLGQAARHIYETRFSLDHVIDALRNDMAVA